MQLTVPVPVAPGPVGIVAATRIFPVAITSSLLLP
jgi:hypothetical protein